MGRLQSRLKSSPKLLFYGTSLLLLRLYLFSMETFLQDLKHSLRIFRQNPGFTAAAVAP